MATIFWSDPHLGLNRTSHTTPASRKALRELLYLQALQVSTTTSKDRTVCLGDLFDTTDNDEATIIQGATVASQCSLVLSGNHDLANRDGKVSSLSLIGELVKDSAIAIDDSEPGFFEVAMTDCTIYAIPHKRTQELFDQSLRNLPWVAPNEPRIVVLHCNYASGFATDEASLNLTKEQAAELTERFDYVLLGHEHIPRSDFGGKLQILGNTHPTSFSDISDKFSWTLVDGVLTPTKIWSTERHRKFTWEELLQPDQDYGDLQFIEITGTAPATKLPEVAKAIQKLWSLAPDALMIRNSVKAESVVVEALELNRALDIPSRITDELQGSTLLPLWLSYLGKI
jgi:DNA repair exonuclease SbcCD nuclease subunit